LTSSPTLYATLELDTVALYVVDANDSEPEVPICTMVVPYASTEISLSWRLIEPVGTAGLAHVRLVKQVAAGRDGDAGDRVGGARKRKRATLRIRCHLMALRVRAGLVALHQRYATKP